VLKRILATLAVVSILASFAVFGSFAIFTDTQSVPNNTFSTGTVDISTNPTTGLVTFSGMAPGDQVTNPITVNNAGTLQLRYAVTSNTPIEAFPALAAQLDLTIKSGVTTCTNAGFGVDGVVIYGPGDLGSFAGINVIGNPTQGAQAGDRTLNAGANETLCFNVQLPLSTSNSYQNRSVTATFNFQAEQTSSNP
jgi:hypothetical protein